MSTEEREAMNKRRRETDQRRRLRNQVRQRQEHESEHPAGDIKYNGCLQYV